MKSRARLPFLTALLALAALASTRANAAMDLRVSNPNGSSSSVSPSREPAAKRISKSDIIAKFKIAQGKQLQVLTNIDGQVKKLMKDSTEISLKTKDLAPAARKLKMVSDSIEAVRDQRDEFLARRELMDQLILLVDTKWNGQPLQEFLSNQLLDMAITDITSSGSSTELGTFMVFLSVALREIPDSREDMVGFVEQYMNFAGVREPKSPTEFLNSRSYTNGSMSLSAKQVDPKELGDHVERKLQQLNQINAKNAADADGTNSASVNQLRFKAPESHKD